MLEDSKNPAVKTVQLTVGNGKLSKPLIKSKNAFRLEKRLGKLKLTAKGWGHKQQSDGQMQKRREKRHGHQ